MKYLRIVPALAAFAALTVNAEAGPRHHHHHHHNNGGAAVGILGAGIFLGALAATAAADSRDDRYVYDAPPPPPPPAYYGRYDRGEEASEAIAACRQGMLDAARRYGAYDAEIGDIYSVRETRFGQIVRADIRIDYREGSRTSPVTCEVEDGVLVSARSDY
ncbi:hypothetical protein IZ6_25830 [Terrihabitans soli]|uniref:Uncharacterized protein n=1 Tax=Terrihabitans soli TaxID=708113 RepID=A0A6S6QZ07_9HYPH|nr:hypothetical protein [Terrihabitans soli]BCJ91848.1 hypothetical protein IZ6_25830 [Terrihabitans soli]